MGIWDRFFGRTVSEAAGFAIGGAVEGTLEPAVQELKNEAWARAPFKPLEAEVAAAIAAEDVEAYQWAEDEAGNTGIDSDRFKALWGEALNAPGFGTLLQSLRRGDIPQDVFAHGLRKAKLEELWDGPLEKLKDDRLGPSVIALAIVRGIMEDPGFLPVGPPATEGNVKAFPTSPLDTLKEAEASGIDRDRLFVETAIAGRPMGPEAAASAVFRQILERVDYDRAIAEGDVRNEWADAIFETARQIPSVADYVNAHIRGWITRAEMHAGAARHGMSPEDVDLLYLRTGRPAAPGQMATAAARGIDGPDGTPLDRAQFLKGIAESDIRPEWGPMLWESRYLYPPLFQLTRLVQAGAIDADTAAKWAEYDRYPPEVVQALHAYWSQPGSSGDSGFVKRAQTQLWSTTHRSYLAGESDEEEASTALKTVGVSDADISDVLLLWQAERGLTRKSLTPTQIKKAWSKAETNPATGAVWTREDAIAALLERGYNANDAASLLDL